MLQCKTTLNHMQHYTVHGSQQFHRKQSKTAYGCPKLIMWV